MKKTFCTAGFLSFALILLFLSFPFHKVSAQKEKDRFVPGRVLVKFRDNVGLDHARQIVAALGARASPRSGPGTVTSHRAAALWSSTYPSRQTRRHLQTRSALVAMSSLPNS